MKSRIINVDIPCRTLQEIRLLHCVSEAGIGLSITTAQVQKFRFLKKYFNIRYEVDTGLGLPASKIICIDHLKPETSFGKISKPLVFSNKMIDKCTAIWNTDRNIPFLFVGLIGHEREEALKKWAQEVFGYQLRFASNNILNKWLNYLFPSTSFMGLSNFKEITIVSSRRGRKFPYKTWDQNYFNELAKSKFVLCPKGDCVWSYRFFEAIMCGAIPIAEEHSPAFEGFQYYQMSDSKIKHHYSHDIIFHNLCVLRNKFTIENSEIIAQYDKFN